MIPIVVNLDIAAKAEKYRRLPADIDAAIAHAFDRIALEGVRALKRELPKFQSIMTNSAYSARVAPHQVDLVVGTRYAEYVHGGTGPAAGQPSYLPNPTHLYEYVKGRAGIGFRNTKPGSAARGAQYDEIRDRAWGLARYIQKHGTKPNPFMERTRAVMEPRAQALVDAALGGVADEANRS